MLRIVQEALVNVAKHAGAELVEIDLELSTQEVTLTIRDDGAGVAEDLRESGAGIGSMRSRAELLGGALRVAPAPRGGTLVSARLPAEPASQVVSA